MLPASKIDSFIFFLLSVKFLLSDFFLSLPLAAFFFCRYYQLSLSYRHYLTSSLSLPLSPTFSSFSAITRLDRVIPLSLPILRMPRSSRSMTGWNDNYSTFPFLPSYPTFLSSTSSLFLPLSPASSSPCRYPRRSPLFLSLPDLIG